MPYTADRYVPQSINASLKKQAARVWAIASVFVFVWVSLIIFAPIALASGSEIVSQPLYSFFSYICHQKPERSFHVAAHHFAVCTRCFGVYFGLLLGFVIYPLWRSIDNIEPFPRFWLFLALVPAAIDWSLGIFGIWGNTGWSRFFTGLILGVACATFIVPALVEIARNLMQKPAR